MTVTNAVTSKFSNVTFEMGDYNGDTDSIKATFNGYTPQAGTIEHFVLSANNQSLTNDVQLNSDGTYTTYVGNLDMIQNNHITDLDVSISDDMITSNNLPKMTKGSEVFATIATTQPGQPNITFNLKDNTELTVVTNSGTSGTTQLLDAGSNTTGLKFILDDDENTFAANSVSLNIWLEGENDRIVIGPNDSGATYTADDSGANMVHTYDVTDLNRTIGSHYNGYVLKTGDTINYAFTQ